MKLWNYIFSRIKGEKDSEQSTKLLLADYTKKGSKSRLVLWSPNLAPDDTLTNTHRFRPNPRNHRWYRRYDGSEEFCDEILEEYRGYGYEITIN